MSDICEVQHKRGNFGSRCVLLKQVYCILYVDALHFYSKTSRGVWEEGVLVNVSMMQMIFFQPHIL